MPGFIDMCKTNIANSANNNNNNSDNNDTTQTTTTTLPPTTHTPTISDPQEGQSVCWVILFHYCIIIE